MSEDNFAAVIGVVGTLVGTLAGAWFTATRADRLARAAITYGSVAAAQSEFSSAFDLVILELHALRAATGMHRNAALGLLSTHYPSHLAAFLKLRRRLPSHLRASIETAWNQYCGCSASSCPSISGVPVFLNVIAKPEFTPRTQHSAEVVLAHVEQLLRQIEA